MQRGRQFTHKEAEFIIPITRTGKFRPKSIYREILGLFITLKCTNNTTDKIVMNISTHLIKASTSISRSMGNKRRKRNTLVEGI